MVTGSIRTAGNLGTTITTEGEVNVSFDYISTTVRVEAKNPRILPEVKGKAGLPFNYSASKINGQSAAISGKFRPSTIETQSTVRSSRGTYTYTKSSSGIYEVTPTI